MCFRKHGLQNTENMDLHKLHMRVFGHPIGPDGNAAKYQPGHL